MFAIRVGNMKKFILLTTAISIVASCSPVTTDGYGPRGEGFIGSAYGFDDRRVSDNSWDVSYTGTSAADARRGAVRRASELCTSIGSTASGFSPSISAQGQFVIASGVVECTLTISQPQKTQGEILLARHNDLTAEIAAIEGAIEASQEDAALGPIIALGAAIAGQIRQGQLQKAKGKLYALEAEMRSAGVDVTSQSFGASGSGVAISSVSPGDKIVSVSFDDDCGMSISASNEQARQKWVSDISRVRGATETLISDRRLQSDAASEAASFGGSYCEAAKLQLSSDLKSLNSAIAAARQLNIYESPVSCESAAVNNSKGAYTTTSCTASSLMLLTMRHAQVCHFACNGGLSQ